MVLSKKARQIIFVSIIAVLVAALVASIVIIVKKNNYIKEIKTQITNNEILIKEEAEKYNKLKEQYDESKQENSEIKKKLEESNAAKEKLEKENSNLKTTIQQLKAKKAQQQAALNNAASNQSQTSPGDKICYLTFDDGPSPVTLRILDTLKKYNAKATFFVINSRYNSYLTNIAADGHTIALHSYSHNYSTIYKSVENYYADLNSISNIVKQYTGIESKVIRFPGGGSNTISRKYNRGIMSTLTSDVQNKGYSYFDWNVSSGDASGGKVSKNTIVNNVLKYSKNKNSVCVLMHDAAAKSTTADALPEIIVGLRNMGFKFEGLKPESYGYHQKVAN